MKRSSLISTLLTVVLVASTVLAIANIRPLLDWWFLRSYQPTAEIALLAEDSFMNDEGRRLFYRSDPQVNPAAIFNQNCPFKERSFVLGCYFNERIYIFDVTDVRLSGVKEVTAAHEMLHVVYGRLSDSERIKINELLDDELTRVENQRILDLVEAYRVADSASIYNEMHSIFGTELRVVAPELEAHYGLYFTDRQALVTVAQNYESVFEALQVEAATLLSDIEGTKLFISSLEEQISTKQASISELKSSLAQYRRTIDQARTNSDATAESIAVDSYNAIVGQLSEAIDAHNRQVNLYNESVEEVNESVEKYNSIVTEQSGLVDSINSKKEVILEGA